MESIKIEETGNTKEISGYISKELTIRSGDNNELLIYSARLDNIKNPNITTPYRNVQGVLLEFYTSLSVMRMKLSASRIYTKEIDWSLFNIPADYITISRAEMEEAINELFR
jgi:hypothetical protein